MSIVVDASVALAWFFDEQRTKPALGILDRAQAMGILVPGLWWPELENGILLGGKRARNGAADAAEFLGLIHDLSIETDDIAPRRVYEDVLKIARQFNLTAYDSHYAELANRKSLPLATFDRALARCARVLKIEVIDH